MGVQGVPKMRLWARVWRAVAVVVALPVVCGCSLLASGTKAEPKPKKGAAPRKSVEVEMPWDTTAARDDVEAPVLKVVTYEDGGKGVPVPYLYGYPIYPIGAASRGILKMRMDNREGAQLEQYEDQDGVARRVERLPQLGCAFEGIEETPTVFVPLTLRCDLPPPDALGGADRPIVENLGMGAKAEEVVALNSLKKAFFGDWHLVEGDLDKLGEGLFNTDHGQLGFAFERGRLRQLVYYFDAPDKRWRAANLWTAL